MSMRIDPSRAAELVVVALVEMLPVWLGGPRSGPPKDAYDLHGGAQVSVRVCIHSATKPVVQPLRYRRWWLW